MISSTSGEERAVRTIRRRTMYARKCSVCTIYYFASATVGTGWLGGEREREEREFIFHIATTLEQAHNRNSKLGGLPERHLAHQSWPPIATIYCKYTVTKLYRQ